MKGLIRIAVVLTASTALAQATGDRVPAGRIIPPNEQIESEMEESRYHFGPIRIQPLFSIRDVGYSGLTIGTTSVRPVADWGATIGAGARLIVPMAPRVYFRASVLPQYMWSLRIRDWRTSGGEHDVAILALLNRVAFEARVRPSRTRTPLSSEDERPVVASTVEALGRAEVQVFRRLSLYGETDIRRPRFKVADTDQIGSPNVSLLTRNDSAVRSGVNYRFSSSLRVAAGVEKTTTKFLQTAGRDNHTDAVTLAVRYDRPRTFANIAVSSRRGKGEPGGIFQDFSTRTGSYEIVRQLAVPVRLNISGRRQVAYSVLESNAYFVETRNGFGVSFPLGRRLALRAFGEAGTNRYPLPLAIGSQESVERSDAAMTLGGGFAVRASRNVKFSTVASHTKYNSNVPGFDRSVLTVTTNLGLSLAFSDNLFPQHSSR